MRVRGISLRTGVRLGVGFVVLAAAASGAVLLSAAQPQSYSLDIAAANVDTTHSALRSVVCEGSFAAQGADGNIAPVGEASTLLAGEAKETADLRLTRAGNWGRGYSVALEDQFGAAQVQSVQTETLRGTVGVSCSEPANDQWFVGGSTSTGSTTTLDLANPGTVPATVQVTVYDAEGEVKSARTAGVIVAAGEQKTVAVAGFAPASEKIAVRVTSTGAAVAARMGVGQVNGLEPFAVSWVSSQAAPQQAVVIPGVANKSTVKQGPSDAGQGDQYPVLVRVFAPGSGMGTAHVFAFTDAGEKKELGTLSLESNKVAELRVQEWPAGANAVVVEAPIPVVAGVLGSATVSSAHDNEWLAPAKVIAADRQVAVPAPANSELVFANTSGVASTVSVAAGGPSGKLTTVQVPASGTSAITVSGNVWVKASEDVFAAVRIMHEGDFAAYPVFVPDAKSGELRVYVN